MRYLLYFGILLGALACRSNGTVVPARNPGNPNQTDSSNTDGSESLIPRPRSRYPEVNRLKELGYVNQKVSSSRFRCWHRTTWFHWFYYFQMPTDIRARLYSNFEPGIDEAMKFGGHSLAPKVTDLTLSEAFLFDDTLEAMLADQGANVLLDKSMTDQEDTMIPLTSDTVHRFLDNFAESDFGDQYAIGYVLQQYGLEASLLEQGQSILALAVPTAEALEAPKVDIMAEDFDVKKYPVFAYFINRNHYEIWYLPYEKLAE